MLIRIAVSLLFSSIAWSQVVSPPVSPTPEKREGHAATKPLTEETKAPAQSLPLSAPVITVAGICADGAPPSANCSIVITRKEFEDLAAIVQPEMTSTERQRLAVLFSQLLVFGDVAQRQGLDKTPGGQVALRFSRLQALSQVLTRKLQAETSRVSPDDVQKYYREHPKEFEQATLERLYVPRNANAGGMPVKEEDVQAEMAKLRLRAVQGESFEALQKQAFADLSLPGNLPATQLQKVRRQGLSSGLASVFDLQLGAVSQPISEANGLYVFRLISKSMLPLQQVTSEVTRTLQTQQLQRALQQATASAKATFDSSYFGVAPKPSSAAPGTGSAPNVLSAPALSPNPPANGLPAAAPTHLPATGQDAPK